MEQQISVFKDKDGSITDWNSAISLEVYEKSCTSWRLLKTVAIENALEMVNEEEDEGASYKDIRKYNKEIAEKLAPCQVLLGTKIGGVTYQVFSSLDFIILETDENIDEDLNNILSEAWNIAYQDVSAKGETGADTHPKKTNIPGEYFFNFCDLKKMEPYATAKETIRPFLHKQNFTRLFLLCDHKMPWFDEEIKQLGLRCSEERIGYGLLLIIEKKGGVADDKKNSKPCTLQNHGCHCQI